MRNMRSFIYVAFFLAAGARHEPHIYMSYDLMMCDLDADGRMLSLAFFFDLLFGIVAAAAIPVE